MKKTVITQIIERLEDAQKHIMANTDYAIGYDGALSDAVTVCKSFLESEKLEIQDTFDNGQANYTSPRDYETGKDYYVSTFGDSNEAGI